jgi:hypothetical protein
MQPSGPDPMPGTAHTIDFSRIPRDCRSRSTHRSGIGDLALLEMLDAAMRPIENRVAHGIFVAETSMQENERIQPHSSTLGFMMRVGVLVVLAFLCWTTTSRLGQHRPDGAQRPRLVHQANSASPGSPTCLLTTRPALSPTFHRAVVLLVAPRSLQVATLSPVWSIRAP